MSCGVLVRLAVAGMVTLAIDNGIGTAKAQGDPAPASQCGNGPYGRNYGFVTLRGVPTAWTVNTNTQFFMYRVVNGQVAVTSPPMIVVNGVYDADPSEMFVDGKRMLDPVVKNVILRDVHAWMAQCPLAAGTSRLHPTDGRTASPTAQDRSGAAGLVPSVNSASPRH